MQAICAVGLVKPRPGIFLEAVQHLLVLCPTTEVSLYHACMGQSVSCIGKYHMTGQVNSLRVKSGVSCLTLHVIPPHSDSAPQPVLVLGQPTPSHKLRSVLS
jgi:hypothetical protein